MRSSGLDQSTLTPVWVNIAQKVICFFVCVHAQSCVLLPQFATPWSVAHQTPLLMKFYRQEYWSGLPCPPPRESS